MSSDNPTADRLVDDARKKSASQQSPLMAQIGIVLGAIGTFAFPIAYFGLLGDTLGPIVGGPLAAWVLGAMATGLGGASIKRGVAVNLAKIALILGVLAILVGTFNFCWATAIS